MNFPVLMIHDEHGQMHAYDKSEVDRLIGYGWRVKETAEIPPNPETITLKTIRRGRPPKGK